MAAKDKANSYAESPAEDADDISAESDAEDATDDTSSSSKVPETFQSELSGVLSQCNNMTCLAYVESEVAQKRKELQDAESENTAPNEQEFDDAGMPENNM